MPDFGQQKPSAIVLVLANVLPLAGVFFWGWSVSNVVALYWLENVILGFMNVLKMITNNPVVEEIELPELKEGDPEFEARTAEMRAKLGEGIGGGYQLMKLFLVPFFVVHYGGFCAGHGFFVFTLLGGGGMFGGGGAGTPGLEEGVAMFLNKSMLLAAAALFASHLFSFAYNYLGRGEYRRTILPVLMFAPYSRIVVLHLAIIAGAFLTMALQSPVWILVVLVGLKTVVDLKLHLREHRKLSATG